MIKKKILWVLLALLVFNIAVPVGIHGYVSLQKAKHSLKFDMDFHEKYDLNIPWDDPGYTTSPLLDRPYCVSGTAVLDLELTSDEFNVTVRSTSGLEECSNAYRIGDDLMYSGNGVFTFCNASVDAGNILPGLCYTVKTGKIIVAPETLSVEVNEVTMGMLFFIIPSNIERKIFNQSFPRIQEE